MDQARTNLRVIMQKQGHSPDKYGLPHEEQLNEISIKNSLIDESSMMSQSMDDIGTLKGKKIELKTTKKTEIYDDFKSAYSLVSSLLVNKNSPK